MLNTLQQGEDVAGWSARLQEEIKAVTGDDAAMSALAIGADFAQLQGLFAPRTQELATQYLQPMDAALDAVAAAEAALEAARLQESETTSGLWQRYKPDYERHLNDTPADDDDQAQRDTDHAELRNLWSSAEPDGPVRLSESGEADTA